MNLNFPLSLAEVPLAAILIKVVIDKRAVFRALRISSLPHIFTCCLSVYFGKFQSVFVKLFSKMSNDSDDDQYNKYLSDPRIPCQYGTKCYQKNPLHHKKYKHPPKAAQVGYYSHFHCLFDNNSVVFIVTMCVSYILYILHNLLTIFWIIFLFVNCSKFLTSKCVDFFVFMTSAKIICHLNSNIFSS